MRAQERERLSVEVLANPWRAVEQELSHAMELLDEVQRLGRTHKPADPDRSV